MDETENQVETTETTETSQTGETPEQLKARLAEQEKRIKELNRESAERRKKLEAYEAAEQKRKEAEMTEAEKLTAAQKAAEDRAAKAEQERDAAIQRANETIIKTRVLMAAAETFIDPEDAWTFIDRAKVTLTETGQVEGIDKALKEVSEKKKHLLKAEAQTDKTKQRTQPQKPTGNKPAPTTNVPKVHF